MKKKKKRKYSAKRYRQSRRFKSYSDDYIDLEKVNRMRRDLGMSELVYQARKCVKCCKEFKGIKGIEFMCERCRKCETSEFEN